ncbi:MAG: 16S rRNA (cytosine(967)-C(5))-methyltransferase [Gammaproteobacteria bacterium HGW-Gammaproteobacteria-1]|jgi:16S rRNA (cytosine967-C5)-methyltransferase|nr:MAG: 16S rRNA (cytosine(967)-C(5))-methyltransferase [Gammaproteobacteria bacterium HGW-Gammaproteobacteria-1]
MAKSKKDDARSAAARVITLVLEEGRSLAAALPPALAALPPAERGLAQELCYGTLRWAPRLEALADKLLDKPLRARDRDVHALLLTGLYQLLYLNVPVHAAVSLTVDATARLGKDWARGLLNGVLRRLQREQEELLAAVDAGETAALAHPAWLLARLQQDWPEHWRDIAAANNARPPMTLRVNRLRGSREQYLERLQQAGLPAAAPPHAPDALTLETPVAVERLPGFADGDVSVQDAAAQLAAGLLQLAPGQRVLDACAAPGGKTGHILEACPEVELLALDSDAERLARVQENLTRLGLTAELCAGDAGDPAAWWDGRPYDRILLDAPCSGSGVIRRHPDIKSLRRAEDIAALNLQQGRLLRALWPLLAPGGILVYATCSILTAENAGQVTAFLRNEAQARELPISAAWGLAAAAGRQILPGENGMDGFYYAALGKA